MNKLIIAILFAFAAFAAADDSLQCYECTTLVGLIEGQLATNASIDELRQKLDYVCNSVSSLKSICESLVNYGLPYIVQLLENETPTKVCQQLSQCTTTVPHVAMIIKPSVLSFSPVCLGCTYVVQAIESYLQTSTNPTTIEKQLEKFCAYLPSLQTQCDAFLDKEIKTIIQWVETTNTTYVCQQLQLCAANAPSSFVQINSPMRIQKAVAAKPMVNFNELACEACQVLVQAAKQYLLNGNTLKQVENRVEALFCNQLPAGNFQQTCDALVAQGYDAALKLANAETPQVACTQQLKVCTAAVRPVIVA